MQPDITLLSWLSPAFPTGSFAYSAGLEAAAHQTVVTESDLQAWLAGHIGNGPLWNDAVILAQAWRIARDDEALRSLAALTRALTSSSERLAEINGQGTSFAEATVPWLPASPLPRDLPYAVALGAAAGRAGLGLNATLSAFIHAFAVNQAQAAIRLSLVGQTGAARILAALAPVITQAAARCAESTLDDLGSAGMLADIAAMRHETLETRLFRS
ncbi:MAG: urease accessory protein UreF [Rhizobiaceae bacterium]|jgi:urease accessory protein|nr:urease accessory protein UreF [Rhizobiaceae bacterium]